MWDVVIIGGGVCGCSLLYALSRYRLRVLLLESENDVAAETTKANSAIVHSGYDPEPGTLMARYNVQGNPMVRELCANLDILYQQVGSLVVGFDEADRATLAALYARGLQNGVPGMRLVAQPELAALEPGLHPAAQFGLLAETAGIVNPWELASAQAEAAVQGGAEVRLDAGVHAIRREHGRFIVSSEAGDFTARFVVNAAGVLADKVSRMAGDSRYAIAPSRGQYFLLDTTQGSLVRHVVFQCPTAQGKGVLVTPTVHGNLLVGPNAEPVTLRERDVTGDDVATTAEGLDFVRESALRAVPGIRFAETIRSFAGLRAVADTGDFVVGESPAVPGFFQMAGIKSPGLTAAPAIAQQLCGMLLAAGLPAEQNPHFVQERRVVRFSHFNEAQRAAAVAQNPLYGQIVCRCQTVTEGELVDALHRPLPPRSLSAVKRRCGPGMGRCQGGFCGPRVQAIVARELGLPQCAVPLERAGTDILIGRTKGEACEEGACEA